MNEPSIKRSIDLRYREKTLPAFRQLPNHRQWSEGVNSPPLQVPLPFREGGQGLGLMRRARPPLRTGRG